MKEKRKDKVFVGPETDSGEHIGVVSRSDGTIDVANLHRAKDGEPVPADAEVVILDEPDSEGWHNVVASYKSGPAQVATSAYREGYDRIFGKQKVGLA